MCRETSCLLLVGPVSFLLLPWCCGGSTINQLRVDGQPPRCSCRVATHFRQFLTALRQLERSLVLNSATFSPRRSQSWREPPSRRTNWGSLPLSTSLDLASSFFSWPAMPQHHRGPPYPTTSLPSAAWPGAGSVAPLSATCWSTDTVPSVSQVGTTAAAAV